MQKLLLSTQQKQKHHQMNGTTSKKKGKKALLEFSESSHQAQHKIRISKTMSSMSIKCGCRRAFIVKQPYLDQNLCQLIFLSVEHKNKEGEVCHGKDVGYWHALGSQLSHGMKAHLMGLLRQGLSLARVMTHHRTHVRKMALKNEHVTQDTFVLLSNVKNLAKKQADELWQKHHKDPISVRMWVLEDPNSVFFYVQHAPMDLNSQTQDDTPFTLGIQTPWQLEIMQNFGHGNVIAFGATFGTNQSKVGLFCYCMNAT
jgi:hypothetical protein